MKYLENNGFLVKKITLIESSKINLTESDLVYNCIDKSENIFYFLRYYELQHLNFLLYHYFLNLLL